MHRVIDRFYAKLLTDAISEVRWAFAEVTLPSEGQLKSTALMHRNPMLWSSPGTVIK
ncbi:hypothetical protein BCM14_0104 [Jezberella montanilacus]|uniref:Uncharacterized protein n=1 Tax=Jezberella montanilacus TaxID=323426 RepID=A0A2T0XQ68_9BURK|nr:hypothetical protein BCM14_0104 [Jezberella montanilacus]